MYIHTVSFLAFFGLLIMYVHILTCQISVFFQSDLLLANPVVRSYLRLKWKKYLALCYFVNLGLYIFFLACLTTFALFVHNPLHPLCESRLKHTPCIWQ